MQLHSISPISSPSLTPVLLPLACLVASSRYLLSAGLLLLPRLALFSDYGQILLFFWEGFICLGFFGQQLQDRSEKIQSAFFLLAGSKTWSKSFTVFR